MNINSTHLSAYVRMSDPSTFKNFKKSFTLSMLLVKEKGHIFSGGGENLRSASLSSQPRRSPCLICSAACDICREASGPIHWLHHKVFLDFSSFIIFPRRALIVMSESVFYQGRMVGFPRPLCVTIVVSHHSRFCVCVFPISPIVFPICSLIVPHVFR